MSSKGILDGLANEIYDQKEHASRKASCADAPEPRRDAQLLAELYDSCPGQGMARLFPPLLLSQVVVPCDPSEQNK